MKADSAALVYANSTGKWQNYRLLRWGINLELNPIHDIFRAVQAPAAEFGPRVFGDPCSQTCCLWASLVYQARTQAATGSSSQPGVPLSAAGGTHAMWTILKPNKLLLTFLFYLCDLSSYSLILLLTAYIKSEN